MTSLGIWIYLSFMLAAWYCIILLILCVNIQSNYSFCRKITPFSCLIVINLWWDLCLVPRLLWPINMVSELMVERSSNLSKTRFLTNLAWKLSNSSKIQHYTRSQGLPLITPSKELVDQACLIDYARCDEILKCASCLTLNCPFCCDFSGFWQVKAFTPADSDGFFHISLDSVQFPLIKRRHGYLATL